ncbi:hypothetical protein [Listeria monocytogenes]|uniref:Uncharacterized protein n=1 Tax=Listeria monocytogenes TaxID=1639 RepID=A0A6C8N3D5_LISMN|nr:hypothetical protein [Listeria monocytogenes]KAA9589870.1 hypothetical protein DCK14_15335 [Listeria monocytogenes]
MKNRMDIMFKGISDDQPIALMSVISITSFPDNKSFDLNDFYLETDKTYKIIYKGANELENDLSKVFLMNSNDVLYIEFTI